MVNLGISVRRNLPALTYTTWLDDFLLFSAMCACFSIFQYAVVSFYLQVAWCS